ncbi:MAG TPA: hypothetical protein VLA61_06575 [Ideonella sp.]|uniref:sensor histidine kinase n=1 Tax=Ideonella sp. TaxID=1929293 RepID=UPI002BB6AB2D|nr:hypothetical protein [Ideonella sp.]HSI47914.1 hypothetical protein [Ideonella sp.]
MPLSSPPPSCVPQACVEQVLRGPGGLLVAFSVLLLLIAGCSCALLRRRARARDREAEQARQLREMQAMQLHDSLLQSTQGLVLAVEGLAATLPADGPVRADFETLLNQADGWLLEARDRVRTLPAAELDASVLSQAIAAIWAELAGGESQAFGVLVQGRARPLRRLVYHEVCGIIREALAHAVAHTGLRSALVTLHYNEQVFIVDMQDNRPDHPMHGLPASSAMHERVARMGGQLRLDERDGGARLQLRLPASLAHEVPDLPAPMGGGHPAGGGWRSLLQRLKADR